MNIRKAIFKLKEEINVSKGMKELMLCLTQQNLNELPWAISLSEYLRLTEIIKEERIA